MKEWGARPSFKHRCDAIKQSPLRELVDAYGPAGYAAYWVLVEVSWPSLIVEYDYEMVADAIKHNLEETKAIMEYMNASGIIKDGKLYMLTIPRERASKEYIEWRKSVFERDKYTCQSCGQVGGTLNAHHIKAWAKDYFARYDISNGITLCVDCHRAKHAKRKE